MPKCALASQAVKQARGPPKGKPNQNRKLSLIYPRLKSAKSYDSYDMSHSLCIIEYGFIKNFNSLTNSNQNANHLPSLESF